MIHIFNSKDLVKFIKSKLGCGYVYGTYGDICTPALRQRKAIQYPAQRYNLLNVSNKWDGKQVFDCAGLIKGFIFSELGVKYSAQYDKGATGMFRDWCAAKNGVWQTLPETAGTLLFKGKPGNFPHVGIYIGDGQVIEAKGARDGVVQTAFKGGGWNYWGQPNIIEYNDKPEPETDYPILQRGAKGSAVEHAQALLIGLGYSLPRYGADGQFGAETEGAVLAFQIKNNLKPDGIIGTDTWTELLKHETRELKYIPENMMRGDDVKRLQFKLKELDLFGEDPHGAFNAKTDTAVRRFQKLNGLEIDGIVDDKIWAALGVVD